MAVACFVAILPIEAFAGAHEEAAALKTKADEAFDGRRFAEALDNYRGALERNRDARLHYNIAQAQAALERYPEALSSYQAFIAEAPAGTLNEAQQAQLFALVEELKRKIARVEIKCDVSGARVLIRGKAVGATPLSGAVVVNAGDAKIEAIAEGYKPFEATLPLAGGSTRAVVIALQRVDFTGVVAVTSNVAGAQVFVDGALRGATPLELRVQRGAHVVTVKAPEHLDQARTATIEAGRRSELMVPLERAPNYTTAYVGFGIGAVGVIGGTITGILAYSSFGKAKEQCDQGAKECGPTGQSELQSSKSWGVLSTAAFGVGIAGIGLGTYGLMTAKPGKKEPAAAVAVYPGGVGLRGSF